jgi:hypothetical protein
MMQNPRDMRATKRYGYIEYDYKKYGYKEYGYKEYGYKAYDYKGYGYRNGTNACKQIMGRQVYNRRFLVLAGVA